MQPLLNIAINAARQAGDIIIRHQEQVEHLKVVEKSPFNVQSEVDIKAEQAIIHTILKAYPHHGIIAEESGIRQENAEVVWIIDPLDGSGNYLHGFPYYAVSIAVRVKQRIEHAVIYDPVKHECFSASRGEGARLNDRRIRVSKQTQLMSSLLGTGFPKHPSLFKTAMSAFEALTQQSYSIRRMGAAALSLAYVASGRLDGFWCYGLNTWDIAAGALLVTEAGGLVSDLKGSEDYLTYGDVVAGPPKVFKAMLQTLRSSSYLET